MTMTTTARNNRRSRGSTLIEVMVASVILILGMTGVVAMMLKGMAASREAAVQREAQNLSASVAAQYATVPYLGLWNGVVGGSYTIDGGILLDPDGRKYPSSIDIADVGDGGIGAVRVTVHTQWTNFLRQPKDAVATTMVSDFPDAG
jgi:type II secretory pathway pseudopilin PulG